MWKSWADQQVSRAHPRTAPARADQGRITPVVPRIEAACSIDLGLVSGKARFRRPGCRSRRGCPRWSCGCHSACLARGGVASAQERFENAAVCQAAWRRCWSARIRRPGMAVEPGAIRPPPSAMAQIVERSHAGVHDLRRTVSSPAERLVRKRCAGQLAMAGSAVTDDRAGDSEGGPTRPRSCWSHCRPPRSRGRPGRQRSGTGTSRCPC